jgi:folate-dependent phosphoribosylglycinamide formyltransferase PurN
MDVVFFFSGGASSMKAVLESPDHGTKYRVVGAVTNAPKDEAPKGWDIAAQRGIGVEYIDPAEFATRALFYQRAAEVVRGIGTDMVGLSGWLRKYSIVDNPFLAEYARRIINVHPADLSVLISALETGTLADIGTERLNEIKLYARDTQLVSSEKWRRVFTGDDAVTAAVMFGEDEVCSTIHSVTAGCDEGPILVQSARLTVDTKFVNKMLERNAFGRIADYARGLQDEMKTKCDGPAFCEALALLADGRMAVGDSFAELDGKPLPYGGYRMG